MSGSLLLWLWLALMVFWGVGVHNRLMRIRARGLDAFGSVEKHMRQLPELVRRHLAGATEGDVVDTYLASTHLPLEWTQLVGALDALDRALKEARTLPLAVPSLAQLGVALETVHGAWAQVCNAPVDLAGSAVSEALQSQWDATTLKVQTARGGMNQILEKYNAARTQFPARLVVGVMGFHAAGVL